MYIWMNDRIDLDICEVNGLKLRNVVVIRLFTLKRLIICLFPIRKRLLLFLLRINGNYLSLIYH